LHSAALGSEEVDMKAKRSARRAVFAAVAALTGAAGFGGCSFDDSASPGNPYNGPDSTVDSASAEAGGDSAAGQLCMAYGGATGVQGISDSIVAGVMADCRIGGYFAGLSSTSAEHFKECFEVYMQSLFSCPGISYIGAKDLSGQACRDMVTAHQGLNATNSDFLAFMNDVITALKAAKMTQADQNTVISALNGVQGVANNKTGNYDCTCANGMGCIEGGTDAGTDSDASTDTGTDDTSTKDTGSPPPDTGSAADTSTPPDTGSPPDTGTAAETGGGGD
jgi:hypothetical protein